MSDNTAHTKTSGGDAIRSIDVTTSKIQAMELLVARAGQEVSAVSRTYPMLVSTGLWGDVIQAFERRDVALRAYLERRMAKDV